MAFFFFEMGVLGAKNVLTACRHSLEGLSRLDRYHGPSSLPTIALKSIKQSRDSGKDGLEEKTHETEPRVVPTDRNVLCSYLLWDCSLHLPALGGPCLGATVDTSVKGRMGWR